MTEIIKQYPRDFTYPEIDEMMADTEYGKKLQVNIRWASYKPLALTNEEWVGLLGRDVDNFYHMRLMRGFTAWFTDKSQQVSPDQNGYVVFTPDEKDSLLLTATVHDYAEAVHGDIPAPQKKEEEEKEEIQTLEKLLRELFSLDHTPDDISQVLAIMGDTTTRLGHAWRTIEDMGYVRAGLLAYRKSHELNTLNAQNGLTARQKTVHDALTGMAFRVMQREIPRLMRYYDMQRYAAVEKLVEVWRPVITHAYANLKPERVFASLVESGNPDALSEASSMVDDFHQSRQMWFAR